MASHPISSSPGSLSPDQLSRDAPSPGPTSARDEIPTRTAELERQWRAYFASAHESPAHPGARDFLNADLIEALRRLIPDDATVLEVGSGTGALLAALPNRHKAGVDYLLERVEQARRAHPDIGFEVADATHLDRWSGPAARGDAEVAGGAPGRFDAIICDRLCHTVIDIKALLESLRGRLAPGGRVYLTVFNYLWEVPTRLAELAGWKHPAPTSNWLSDHDLKNLFEIAGLEVVRYEDRLLLPVELPVASTLVNRYLARLPVMQNLSLYRVYVLRDHGVSSARRAASVSVVVPSRNEAGNVQAAIDRTPVMGESTELIFVEGGSSDGTWQVIEEAIARYRGPLKLSAYQQTGKGKGDAVRLGFAKATGDLLMILDADLTVPPEDLPTFYEVALRGQGDYVQGTRLVYPMERNAMRFFNKIGNVAFSQLFTYLLRQPIRDTLCGTKVLWRRDYQRLAAARHYFGDFDPFGDFDLIFGAARLNLKITEIPIRYRDRTYGETNISRWKHGVLLLKMSLIAARKLRFV
jgi:SAM-dependent methyltransferase